MIDQKFVIFTDTFDPLDFDLSTPLVLTNCAKKCSLFNELITHKNTPRKNVYRKQLTTTSPSRRIHQSSSKQKEEKVNNKLSYSFLSLFDYVFSSFYLSFLSWSSLSPCPILEKVTVIEKLKKIKKKGPIVSQSSNHYQDFSHRKKSIIRSTIHAIEIFHSHC